ncbi:MAG: hypothetical protein ACXVCA_20045, partial [Bdellovibrio sp.]
MIRTSRKRLTAIGAAALFAAGCSGGGSSSPTSATTANIFGKVTGGSITGQSLNKISASSSFRNKIGKQAVTGLSGCTVRAYDVLTGSQVGAAATTNADGNYTIDQLNAGDAYKVVADCGGSGKFSSVETS